jgi:hypothetical protein
MLVISAVAELKNCGLLAKLPPHIASQPSTPSWRKNATTLKIGGECDIIGKRWRSPDELADSSFDRGGIGVVLVGAAELSQGCESKVGEFG